jgi:predicted RNA-binding Zn-ribbon protein involved in translation (DUF1610 family)
VKPHKTKVARRAKLIDSKIDKNKGKFQCGKCGHVWWGKMMKKNPIGQEPSEQTLKFFTRYWADGVNLYCPNCSTVKEKMSIRRG